MRSEIREIEVIHPVAGAIVKKFVYTWDETEYATLDLAIEDYELTNGIENEKQDKSTVNMANVRGYKLVQLYTEPDIDLTLLSDRQLGELANKLEPFLNRKI